MTATRNSSGYPREAVCLSYDKYYDSLTKIGFSARWIDLQNRNVPVSTEFESGFGIPKQNQDNPG